MIPTLHGQVTLHSNILSDVRIAKEAGYLALELHTDKLNRYLDAGRSANELRRVMDDFGIQAAAIDIIGGIEVTGREAREKLFQETERLCTVAKTICAPTIQLNPFSDLDGLDISQIINITAINLRQIADIGKSYGIRFQIEGAAWTPIHTLEDCLRLIEATGRDNVGLVIDFWHFWAGRGTRPEDIAKLDSELIYGVHVSDGYRPGANDPWVDETKLRGVLPGEGEIPIQEWVDSVKATGFDGYTSGEFLNPKLWEQDHIEVAIAMRLAMERYY